MCAGLRQATRVEKHRAIDIAPFMIWTQFSGAVASWLGRNGFPRVSGIATSRRTAVVCVPRTGSWSETDCCMFFQTEDFVR